MRTLQFRIFKNRSGVFGDRSKERRRTCRVLNNNAGGWKQADGREARHGTITRIKNPCAKHDTTLGKLLEQAMKDYLKKVGDRESKRD